MVTADTTICSKQLEKEDISLNLHLGLKLKCLRKKFNLTQSKLAELLNCSYQLIQKLENGESRMQIELMYAVSELFDVSPNYFFEGYKEKKINLPNLPKTGDIIKAECKNKWNILLIEDNPEDEFLLRKAFESFQSDFDLNTHTCYDGIEAINYLKCNSLAIRPDLIFLDLNIPKMNGVQFLKDIKKDTSLCSIPVVVITNSIKADEMLQCYKLYVSGYLVKSFDICKFQEKIRATICYWCKTVTTPMNY